MDIFSNIGLMDNIGFMDNDEKESGYGVPFFSLIYI